MSKAFQFANVQARGGFELSHAEQNSFRIPIRFAAASSGRSPRLWLNSQHHPEKVIHSRSEQSVAGGFFITRLSRRPPCVMALLPSAGFNACDRISPDEWHCRANLGYRESGMKVTTRCVTSAGRQSESRRKTLRAGTSRCEGREVGLSYAKMGRTPAYEVGRELSHKQVSASRPLGSNRGGICRSKLGSALNGNGDRGNGVRVPARLTRAKAIDTNAARTPNVKPANHPVVAASCLRTEHGKQDGDQPSLPFFPSPGDPVAVCL